MQNYKKKTGQRKKRKMGYKYQYNVKHYFGAKIQTLFNEKLNLVLKIGKKIYESKKNKWKKKGKKKLKKHPKGPKLSFSK